MFSTFFEKRLVASQTAGVVACALLTALGARLATPLPFTPVPATWQVAAVLFAGLTLGARGAFASQALYLLAGLLGAPVFAFGNGGAAYLFNPAGTGGYLLSYPLAAWAVGSALAHRQSRFAPLWACAAGLGVVYALGCLWFGFWLRLSPGAALVQGAGWFLFWDMAKALLVVVAVRVWTRGRSES